MAQPASAARLFRRSLTDVWQSRFQVSAPGSFALLAILCLVCVAAGMGTANWRGVPIHAGPFAIELSFCPPLILLLVVTLCANPAWGLISGYLASLLLWMHDGMPFPIAAAAALTTPLALAVIWTSMAVLEVSPSLRCWAD